MRNFHTVNLNIERRFFPVYHIQVHRIHGILIFSLISEIYTGSDSCRHFDLCLQICPVLVLIGLSVIVIYGKFRIYVRRHKNMKSGYRLMHQVVDLILRHRNNRTALDVKRNGTDIDRHLDCLSRRILFSGIKIIEANVLIPRLRQVNASGLCSFFHNISYQE